MFSYVISDFLAIDECATNTHNCHRDAICKDLTPLFTCTCKLGYQGDGKNCTGKYHFYFATLFYLRNKDLKIEVWPPYRKRMPRSAVSGFMLPSLSIFKAVESRVLARGCHV